MELARILPPAFKDEVINWLRDDCPAFDVGGFVVGSKIEVAHLICKENCILAGIPFANVVFECMKLSVNWKFEEGSYIDVSSAPQGRVVVAEVVGPCNQLLLAERTALNIVSRACGVATLAHRAKRIADEVNWHGWVAGTRKTTPGFKIVEKYALLVGGCATHRLDLSQMTMLKDNHIMSRGSITAAVKAAKSCSGFSTKVEVECQSSDEALEACSSGADIVMLDNFKSDTIHAAARIVKDLYPHVLVEASGGIRLDTMQQFMGPHVDIISMGALTHGYQVVDFSLKVYQP